MPNNHVSLYSHVQIDYDEIIMKTFDPYVTGE